MAYKMYKKDGTLLNDQPIRIRVVEGNISKAKGGNVTMTAPNIDGYKFMFWSTVATDGWASSVYPASPTSQTCKFWNTIDQGSGTGKIRAVAVYTLVGFD